MRRAKVAALAAQLSLLGCAAPQAELAKDVLQRMQAEARSDIYNRENDVAIARNRIDEVRARSQELRRQIDELDEHGKKLRERLAKSGVAGGDKASKLLRPFSAHRGYYEAQLRQLAARLDVAEARAAAARGRLEQTRQRELVRTGRAPAKSMKAFDESVEGLEKQEQESERRDGDLRMETEKSYERWKAAEDEFAQVTGDWDSAVWTD